MDTTKPKPFIFVLMPFAAEFDDIYQLGIKPACAEAGAYSERLDEQIFDESMLERIYNQISKADLIVADMTGRNSNVFYEVGYAHALGKKVVLLTQKSEDIPFDLKHYHHIVYSGRISQLKEDLSRRVSWYVEQAAVTDEDGPADRSVKRRRPLGSYKSLELYIGGQRLISGSEIIIPRSDWEHSGFGSGSNTYSFTVTVDLSVHNPTNRTQVFDTGVALITESSVALLGYRLRSKQNILPDGRIYVEMPFSYSSFAPYSWENKSFKLEITADQWSEGVGIGLILRFFSTLGVEDIEFTLLPEFTKIIVDGSPEI